MFIARCAFEGSRQRPIPCYNRALEKLSPTLEVPALSEVFDLEARANNIRIVLVNTSHPGNIGAAARAMKNMGLSKITLVDPEDFPSPVAMGRAVSAADILENAVVTKTLEEGNPLQEEYELQY